MTDNKSAMQVDTALVRQLAELLNESDLTEIEVEDGARKIRVARTISGYAPLPAPLAPATSPAAPAAAGAPPTPPAVPPAESGEPVKSPMVGTAYLSAEPGARPFAAVGDVVSEGQTLLIIEAMKVMNPIASPRAGRIVRLCVENGQPVEFDQPLVIIDSAAGAGPAG